MADLSKKQGIDTESMFIGNIMQSLYPVMAGSTVIIYHFYFELRLCFLLVPLIRYCYVLFQFH